MIPAAPAVRPSVGMTLGAVDAGLIDLAVPLRGLAVGPARWDLIDKADRLLDIRLALTRPVSMRGL